MNESLKQLLSEGSDARSDRMRIIATDYGLPKDKANNLAAFAKGSYLAGAGAAYKFLKASEVTDEMFKFNLDQLFEKEGDA